MHGRKRLRTCGRVYVCVHACLCVRAHVGVPVCARTRVCVCAHECLRVCVFVCVCVCALNYRVGALADVEREFVVGLPCGRLWVTEHVVQRLQTPAGS